MLLKVTCTSLNMHALSERGTSMEALSRLGRAFLDEPKAWLVLIGPVVMVVGLSGAVPYVPISNQYAQIAAAVFGIGLTLLGVIFLFQGRSSHPYGVEITSPHNNASSSSFNTIVGTAGRIPEGKELWLVRIFQDERFYPVKRISLVSGEKRWQESFELGSAARVGAFVFDEKALALISYQKEAAERHDTLVRQFNVPRSDPNCFLPAFRREFTKVLKIRECHVITVAIEASRPAPTIADGVMTSPATSRQEVLFERMRAELADGRYTWRTIERLAISAGASEAKAHEILAARDEIVLSKGKSGEAIARLAARNP